MTLWTKGVRAVAILVGVKGLLGFLGAFLVLSIGHRAPDDVMDELLAFVHLNPDGSVAHWLGIALGKIHNHHTLLAFMGFGYGTLKLVEGVGLWFEQRWAEWLVLLSTALLFLPAEIEEIWHRVTWLRVGALILSLGVIVFMAMILVHDRKRRNSKSAIQNPQSKIGTMGSS